MPGKVLVYCASSSNVDRIYLDSSAEFGRMLAQEGYHIIYGGGKAGLMGVLADSATESGGKVTGIIPAFMIDIELGNNNIHELIVVKDMHERQRMMMDISDLAVALPGGSGTFTEFMEIISWKRLGLVIHPVILVNINNYFDPMIEMLNKAIKEKFMAPEYNLLWDVVPSVDQAIETINERLKYL